MKSRVITSSQRRIMAEAVKSEVSKQIEAASVRTQGLWMVAMLNAGLSVRTINRVLKELDPVVVKYGTGIEDGVGDYALFTELQAAGIKIALPDGIMEER